MGTPIPDIPVPGLVAAGRAATSSTESHGIRWLRALYLFNGFGSGALYGFVAVLLQSKGFEPAQIGITMSLASFAFAVSLPLWGHLGDVVIGPRRALQLGLISVAVFGFGFNLELSTAAFAACWIVIMASSPIYSLSDSIAMGALRDAPQKYTRTRLLAPIGMAVGSIVFGYLYSVAGYWLVPVCSLTALIGTFVCAQLLPLGRDYGRARGSPNSLAKAADVAPRRKRFGSPGRALRLQPSLIPVLAAAMVLFMSFPIVATYLGLRIVDLGGGPQHVGLTNGIGFAAQIPGMLVAGFLVARLGPQRVLVVAAVGSFVSAVGFIVFDDLAVLIPIRFLSELSHAAALIALVLAIARMLPSRLQATGQTLVSATCFGVGPIIATFIGGILYADYGALGAFGLAAVCALAGGTLVLFALPQKEPKVAHA